MSEADVPAAAAHGPTAGTLLREAREAAGLHVDTLAANLKVPVRKLEALEEDRYDLLPDAVFVRALASSVCRSLKLDPQPVLQRLPQTAQPRLVQDTEGINAPFRSPGDAPRPGWLDQVSRPVMLIVVALLLAALVLIFLPVAQRSYQNVVAERTPDPVMPPPGAAANVPTATPPIDTAAAPTPTASAAPAESPGVAAVAPSVSPAANGPSTTAVVPAPAAAAVAPAASAAVAAASSATPPNAAAADANGIVTFRTRGASWVQVTDASGTPVLRRLMQPGESAAASGKLPLSVTVGSVEATDVQVRGQPFNLAPLSRDNVARFEVK